MTDSQTLGNKALELAKQSVGVKEESPNWGKFVAVYLKCIGILFPAPWCAAFVAYKVHQAAAVLGIKAKWPKWGLVAKVVTWAKAQGITHPDPIPGYVFAVYHPELRRYAHIGFIAEVRKVKDGRWLFRTVEGNSNSDGSREGKEVASNWRSWNPKRHICIEVV
jgi:hypothetical protein